MGLYYAIAGYWILVGLVHLVLDSQRWVSLPKPLPGRVSTYFCFLIAIGLFQVSLGLGLVLKWGWARAVVKVFCWIRIFLSTLAMIQTFFGAVAFESTSILTRMLFIFLDLLASGVLLWLLAETDETYWI